MLFYLLDLLGVAVFAVSGALAAGHASGGGLDLLGVFVLAALTGIGGGTVRDLLLNRHPLFWTVTPAYLAAIAGAALLTVLCTLWRPVPAQALLVADACGLALCALSGAQAAEETKRPALVVVLMGTIGGVAGGMMRDVAAGKVPLVLRQDVYATAAVVGIVAYLLLQRLGLPRAWAFGAGIAVVIGLRLPAALLGWQLPRFHLA